MIERGVKLKRVKRALYALLDLLVSWILLVIYTPLCSALFMIIPMGTKWKIFTVPIVEESLRLLSIFLGGAVQYVFTILFAVNEYMNFVYYSSIRYGDVPDGYPFYRFLCILGEPAPITTRFILYSSIFFFKFNNPGSEQT